MLCSLGCENLDIKGETMNLVGTFGWGEFYDFNLQPPF